MSEKPQIDLNKYRQHQKKIPWGLIRKIIIGVATILLLYYFVNQMENTQEKKSEKSDEIEVDVAD